MSDKHYSVRQSNADSRLWKVVIAGGWGGYSDTDTGLYPTFEAALKIADALNASKALRDRRS